MKIPEFLYGRQRAVMSYCKTIAKKVIAEGPDVLDPGPMIDTSTSGGLILLDKDASVAGQDNFHCFALSLAIAQEVSHETWLRVTGDWLRWSFEEPWRFLCAYTRDAAYFLHRHESLVKPYVETALEFWPILFAEGRRYGPCWNDEPCDAWEVNSGLKFALARLGVSTQDLLGRLPASGPAGLLDRNRYS
jgi:hypothetical protein